MKEVNERRNERRKKKERNTKIREVWMNERKEDKIMMAYIQGRRKKEGRTGRKLPRKEKK